MDKLIRLLSAFMLLSQVGCVTSSLKIETNPPGADVLVKVDNQPPRKIGQSPYEMGATDLALLSNNFVITLQKPGFKSENVFVSSKSLPYEALISANLSEEFAGAGSMNLEVTMEEIARGTAQVQNLMRSREFDKALSSLSILISKYPTVATFYGLEANIYYLQKNVDKALLSYQKANKLSPNPETERMITRLEELRGGRSPASSKGGER